MRVIGNIITYFYCNNFCIQIKIFYSCLIGKEIIYPQKITAWITCLAMLHSSSAPNHQLLCNYYFIIASKYHQTKPSSCLHELTIIQTTRSIHSFTKNDAIVCIRTHAATHSILLQYIKSAPFTQNVRPP